VSRTRGVWILLGLLMLKPCGTGIYARIQEQSKITDLAVERGPQTLTADGTLTLTIEGGGGRSTLQIPTFIHRVVQSSTVQDKAVIVGDSGGFAETIVLDLTRRSIVSRSIGYGTQLLQKRWLVSVEWYPNHVFPPQYPTDIVLVRDLEKDQVPKVETAGITLRQLIEGAGSPVFPLGRKGYDNIQQGDDTINRIARNTFAMLHDEQLCFVSSHGPDGSPQTQELAIVSLRDNSGSKAVRFVSLATVRDSLGRTDDEPLEFESIEETGPSSVRLRFPHHRYKRDSYDLYLR
jgi:hypothetical protein